MRAARPGLVIVDLIMPVLNGEGFIEAVRADPATEGVRVVLMTGATPRAGDAPTRADALLPKPFELDDLMALVRRMA